MELYEEARHRNLASSVWDERKARSLISNIFNSVEASYQDGHGWQPHPDDANDAFGPDGEPHLQLYFGTAGTVWGQDYLGSRGYGSTDNDYHPLVEEAWGTNAARLRSVMEGFPDGAEYARGLLLGDMGFIVTLLRLKQSNTLSGQLLCLADENAENSIGEYMWGSAGSLAAALAFANALDADRLSSFAKRAVASLEQQLIISPSLDCWTWRQNLYGNDLCIVGAVHGFAGNAFSILKALEYLSSDQKQIWRQTIRDTAIKTAHTQGVYSNWRMCIDYDENQENNFLVQFCHGAPGVVCCLASLIDGTDDEFDSLMIRAGELIWKAGPLEKGANLCHGTSGNGYAFLKLFQATRDQRWLDRARSFAMTAIAQSQESHDRHGRFHHSLWTGDIGLAIYLDACIEENANIPTMDFF